MKIDQHEVHFHDNDYAKRATVKEDYLQPKQCPTADEKEGTQSASFINSEIMSYIRRLPRSANPITEGIVGYC